MLLRQDIIIQQTVNYSVEKVVDSARECGYITLNMYNDFVYEVMSTGTDYDIKLKHFKKYYYEEEGEFSADYSLYTDEITEALFLEGIYYLNVGDLFVVEIISTEGTLGMNMTEALTGTGKSTPIFARAGGMVLNENN
ncbi:MAG: hypothetical protein K0R15_1973 [Clostridiales bacterium]|jgi:hypothetical protein|nr:hypothetical protein [Clostridiales bacterium]